MPWTLTATLKGNSSVAVVGITAVCLEVVGLVLCLWSAVLLIESSVAVLLACAACCLSLVQCVVT
jgi:hypothetical protein